MIHDQPLCCLTIDVEDYYHIEAAYGHIPRRDWPKWPGRVVANVNRLLDLLETHHCRGTFFVLGDVARRYPNLARSIAAAGHEIASHGHDHDRLHRLTPRTFHDDLSRSKKLLEDQIGQPVRGYRAPTFSITRATAWAIDVLLEAGFEYDASIFPVTHPAYGVPHAPCQPFYVSTTDGQGQLLEIPPLTWRVALRNVAVAGGGYFRLLPLWFMQQGLRQAARQQRPAVLYFHPWEFDPDLPRMPLNFTGRVRTYTGLNTAAEKLDRILQHRADWRRMDESLPVFHRMAETQNGFRLAA